jgi:hypothetical protein
MILDKLEAEELFSKEYPEELRADARKVARRL